MLKIGLTGGIGSGKSAVAEIFNVLGIPVFNADSQAKLIMEEDENLVLAIKKLFGEESYSAGKLNRPYLSGIVFKDASMLKKLNALVHPAAIDAADSWMNKQTTPYVIKEAALLFESGSASNLNYIIGIKAPRNLRIKRAMERDKITREAVIARINRQMNEASKMKRCNFIIVNNEKQLLIPQVLTLHHKFLHMSNNSTYNQQ